MLFLGPLFPLNDEEKIQKRRRRGGSNAANVFQWNLIKGLYHHVGDDISVVNVLPVGTWPKAYRDFCLESRDWSCDGVKGHEIGSFNFPFLKQYHRTVNTKKHIKKLAEKEKEIIIYSAYLPFLKAVYKLPKDVKITLVVTDLPEFYDLGKTSNIRKTLRNLQNRIIYKYMSRIDRFVVLTKQMCGPLSVGNRPWICIEGICNYEASVRNESGDNSFADDKKAILYSGSLHYQYGIQNLLDAFSKIEDPDAKLWICGGGEAAANIEKLTKEDERVKFFGFCTLDEVAKLREKAGLLVNPRTNEGEYTKYSFPSKTMEYMASGKPVVMYKLDGIPEEYDSFVYYADGENAVEGLKNSIVNVMENYDEALLKAKEAQNFVLTQKSSVYQSKRLLDFIDNNK